MITIAVTNNKGGVGKTETVRWLGFALAHLGFDVVLVDLDGQPGNLTHRLGVTPGLTVVDAFNGVAGVNAATVATAVGENVWLLPSDASTDDLADDLVLQPLGVMRLANILAPLDTRGHGPRVVLLDCPPNVGSLTFSALVAADWVITPTTPEASSIAGIERIHAKIADVREHLHRAPLRMGSVVVKVRETTEHRAGLTAISAMERILGTIPLRGGVDGEKEIRRAYTPIADTVTAILEGKGRLT